MKKITSDESWVVRDEGVAGSWEDVSGLQPLVIRQAHREVAWTGMHVTGAKARFIVAANARAEARAYHKSKNGDGVEV